MWYITHLSAVARGPPNINVHMFILGTGLSTGEGTKIALIQSFRATEMTRTDSAPEYRRTSLG